MRVEALEAEGTHIIIRYFQRKHAYNYNFPLNIKMFLLYLQRILKSLFQQVLYRKDGS